MIDDRVGSDPKISHLHNVHQVLERSSTEYEWVRTSRGILVEGVENRMESRTPCDVEANLQPLHSKLVVERLQTSVSTLNVCSFIMNSEITNHGIRFFDVELVSRAFDIDRGKIQD